VVAEARHQGWERSDGQRVTTINADLAHTPTRAAVATTATPDAARRRATLLSPGTLGIAAATGLVVFEALDALVDSHGLGTTLAAGWAQLVAPAFVVLVLVAVACERLWPAERRPFLARGHVQDASYFLLYIAAIAPFMTLLSVGSAVILRSHAGWLEGTWTEQWPRWTVVVVALLAMDLCNWLAHWGDHHVGALWRVHALHHSQEELSVLTSFRAHPLMHTTGFVLATVPVLLLTGAHPLAPVLITVYVCLGTLPHTNVRWSYGPLGRILVSPAYHRQHHAIEGQQEANLGVVFTVWDALAGCARFPVKGAEPCATGLAGRPVVVEQATEDSHRAAPARLLVRQLAQPFTAA
jgi:sterol desaturase/sphingolipid hydroxylase (fatty acid hydroxylase superfamily)